MNNELNSVEDIDTMLDNEFKLTNEQSSEDVEETNGNVEEQETEDDENQESGSSDETKDDDNVEENEEVNDNKPSADDKKEFAFSKMRKENSDLKSQINEQNQEVEFLKKLASQYGYTDIKKFQADYEKARIQQEAKDKGLDPVLYSQLQESNKRIAELENKQKEAELVNKANFQ